MNEEFQASEAEQAPEGQPDQQAGNNRSGLTRLKHKYEQSLMEQGRMQQENESLRDRLDRIEKVQANTGQQQSQAENFMATVVSDDMEVDGRQRAYATAKHGEQYTDQRIKDLESKLTSQFTGHVEQKFKGNADQAQMVQDLTGLIGADSLKNDSEIYQLGSQIAAARGVKAGDYTGIKLAMVEAAYRMNQPGSQQNQAAPAPPPMESESTSTATNLEAKKKALSSGDWRGGVGAVMNQLYPGD